MKLDKTFLTVHPRTAAWWIEREQCRACHYHEREAEADVCLHPGCVGEGTGQGVRANKVGRPCISAREGVCGPGAALFTPKEGNAS